MKASISCGVFVFVLICRLGAAEYFVAPGGSDDHDGLSQQGAFGTVQRGVDALQPGDTLTLLPGEYRESVFREGLGGSEAQTVIRAAIPGTVTLRGDLPLEGFEKVDTLDNVWVAEFDGVVQAVLEVDTLTQFPRAPSIGELQYTPGEFFHDAESGRLYISTTDYQPPQDHIYKVAVTPACGIELVRPTRVTVEGLAFTGYIQEEQRRLSEGFGTVWGLWMEGPRDCVIRDCFAILNSGGIAIRSAGRPENEGGGNLIEDCVAVANFSHSTASIAGIGCYNPNDDIIRDCLVYQPQGGIASRFYSSGHGPALMDGVIALGGFLAIKGLDEYTFEAEIRNSVSLGQLNSHILTNSVVGGRNIYADGAGNTVREKDVIELGGLEGVKLAAEFADPVNGDFRLQSTSRFKGRGESGSDPGINPGEGSVYFLAMDGSDEADGGSLETAWRTIGHAVSELRPGDTLYLTEGVYSGDVTLALKGSGTSPTRILGRGRDRVRISGEWEIEGSSVLEISRLHFDDTLQIDDSAAIDISHCVFSFGDPGIEAENVDGLRVTHGLFMPTNSACIDIEDSSAVFLQSNLFANRSGVAVAVDRLDAVEYSDYNVYERASNVWFVDDHSVGLKALAPLERAAVVSPVQLVERQGVFEVLNSTDFAGRSIRGAAFGPHRYQRSRDAVVDNLRIHSVGATTANFEWQSTHPGIVTVAWGETPDTVNRQDIIAARFGTFSLNGLEPDRQYYFRIVSATSTDHFNEGYQADTFAIRAPLLRFQTAASDPDGRTYHVSPDGEDNNSGMAPGQAWRSVDYAASRLRPGDTLLIGSGTYSETVRVRATGTTEKPITFRAAPGALVEFKGQTDIRNFFIVGYKDHIHIDGLRFDGVSGRSPGQLLSVAAILAFSADGLELTRCMLDGRSKQYSRGFALIMNSRDVRIENCVQIDNMGALQVFNCPDITIANCVFLRPKIAAVEIVNRPGDKAYVVNNLFSDSLRNKASSRLIAIGRHETLHFENNGFYMRRPREERIAFGVYGEPAYQRSADAYWMRDRDEDPAHPVMEEDHVWRTIPEWDEEFATEPSRTLFGDPELAVFQDEAAAEAAAQMVARAEEIHPEYKIQRFDWLLVGARRGERIGFSELFVTNPEFVERGIGLQPEVFEGLPDDVKEIQ